MLDTTNPFHAGELKAQERAGAKDVADWAASFIRPLMPDQHRTFFEQLPFLVLAGADTEGRHWVTLLDGEEGFVRSPDASMLTINTRPDPQDPLADALTTGTDIGMLGIELATRRRNRLSGRFRAHDTGYAIDVRQSYGNCPQFIHERTWQRVSAGEPPAATLSAELSDSHILRIQAADTLFLGTGNQAEGSHASNGFDASHRGGTPGFVQVISARQLRIPDYAGNNFFNTIGNLLENPAIGLVFVDFETGGLLQVSGRATIDWDAVGSHDDNALRMIDVTIDAVVDRPAALSLRWSRDDADLRTLVVSHKVQETADITSFNLRSVDDNPLESFEAGQHLPIELSIAGQSGPVKRSYSLSGAPGRGTYRLSIKREVRGVASQFLHDAVHVGDRIQARSPSGNFVLPCNHCPLVLASAGVGLTPMLSMLHAVAKEDGSRPVWYVHGARNGAYHAFKSEVAELVASRANLVKRIHYSQPDAADAMHADHDATGRITAQMLLDLNAGTDARYMLCGPAQWVSDLRTGLESAGVPVQNIHLETFGPS